MGTKKTLIICQFCLKVADEVAADNNKRGVLKPFLSNDVIDTTNMCKICSNKFRVKRLEQSNEAFSAENVTDFMEYDGCCLCRGIFECSQLVDVSIMTLKKCFPEMRQLENYKYKSCERCRQSLQDFHMFSRVCTNSSQKILDFCSVLNITPHDVSLYEVYQFLYNPSNSEGDKNILTSANRIKDEENDTSNKEPLLHYKSPTETEVYEKSLIKTEREDSIRKYLLVGKNPPDTKKFKCELCPYRTVRKSHLKRHSLTHKDSTKVKLFECDRCDYETKFKQHLKRHFLTHKSHTEIEMFICELCPYKTKHKFHLQRHLSIHKDSVEVAMFKCELCPYETKYKHNLKKHSSAHKDSIELTMFKCEKCNFETKFKGNLTKHLLTHESPRELEMFKCELCPYETKRKDTLKQHLLIHKYPTEVTVFKCGNCDYKTKRKNNLKYHLLKHKSPAELEMFKCERCLFETKHKNNLKRHLLRHKKPTKVTCLNVRNANTKQNIRKSR